MEKIDPKIVGSKFVERYLEQRLGLTEGGDPNIAELFGMMIHDLLELLTYRIDQIDKNSEVSFADVVIFHIRDLNTHYFLPCLTQVFNSLISPDYFVKKVATPFTVDPTISEAARNRFKYLL